MNAERVRFAGRCELDSVIKFDIDVHRETYSKAAVSWNYSATSRQQPDKWQVTVRKILNHTIAQSHKQLFFMHKFCFKTILLQFLQHNICCSFISILCLNRRHCCHCKYTVSGKTLPQTWQNNFMNRKWWPLFFFVSWKAIYLQCLCEISRQLACPLLSYCFLQKKMVENIAVFDIVNNTCMTSTRLDGTTDRGVVRLGSQHHLCGNESVAYSSASLSQHRKRSSFKFYTQCLNEC